MKIDTALMSVQQPKHEAAAIAGYLSIKTRNRVKQLARLCTQITKSASQHEYKTEILHKIGWMKMTQRPESSWRSAEVNLYFKREAHCHHKPPCVFFITSCLLFSHSHFSSLSSIFLPQLLWKDICLPRDSSFPACLAVAQLWVCVFFLPAVSTCLQTNHHFLIYSV